MKAYDLTYLMRRVGLLVLAAVGVHQLRYLVAYGSDSGSALAQQGHGYLAAALPDLIGTLTVVIVATIAAAAVSGGRSRASSRALPEWVVCSISILLIFACQELAEGFAASGHPAGLAALVANGGWIAAPLALLFGALVALALRLLNRADRVLVALAERPDRVRRSTPQPAAPPDRGATPLSHLALAFGFARRPPPVRLRSV